MTMYVFCFNYLSLYYSLTHPFTHSPASPVYKQWMPVILKAVHQHLSELKPGEPQLNWCDRAVEVSVMSDLYTLVLL